MRGPLAIQTQPVRAHAHGEENLHYELDALRSQAEIAGSRGDRLALERSILDAMEKQERAELETAISAGKLADATKARGDLAAMQAGRRVALDRQYETPLAKYGRELSDPDRKNDAVENAVVGELQSVRDSITSGVQKALGIENPVLAALINSFIEQQLIKPLLEGLSGAGGGGGGFLGGLVASVGSIFGFSSGGSMTLGGNGGTDRNQLSLNGRPIANVSRGETLNVGTKALGGRSGGTTIVQNINVDGRNSVTPEGFARQILAISNQQAVQASSSMGQAVIKGVPKRMAQFNRDGT